MIGKVVNVLRKTAFESANYFCESAIFVTIGSVQSGVFIVSHNFPSWVYNFVDKFQLDFIPPAPGSKEVEFIKLFFLLMENVLFA